MALRRQYGWLAADFINCGAHWTFEEGLLLAAILHVGVAEVAGVFGEERSRHLVTSRIYPTSCTVQIRSYVLLEGSVLNRLHVPIHISAQPWDRRAQLDVQEHAQQA